MKNREIRKITFYQFKNNFKEIAKVSAVFLLLSLFISLIRFFLIQLGYPAEYSHMTLNDSDYFFKGDYTYEILLIFEIFKEFTEKVGMVFIVWLLILIGLRGRKNEESIELFSKLKDIKKFIKFIGINIYVGLKLVLWALIIAGIPLKLLELYLNQHYYYTFRRSEGAIFLAIIILIVAVIFIIRKAISYSFAPYIYLESDEIDYGIATKQSMEMIKNQHFKYFRFSLLNIFVLQIINYFSSLFFALTSISMQIGNLFDEANRTLIYSVMSSTFTYSLSDGISLLNIVSLIKRFEAAVSLKNIYLIGILIDYFCQLFIMIPLFVLLNVNYYLQLKKSKEKVEVEESTEIE